MHPSPPRRLWALSLVFCVALASTTFAQTPLPLYKITGVTVGRPVRANAASTGKAAVTGRVTTIDQASLAALTTLRAQTRVILPLTDSQSVAGTVNLVRHQGGQTRSGGTLADGVGGTFYLNSDGTNVSGFILRPDLGTAYRFETPAGGATVLREVPINAVVCGAMPLFLGGPKAALQAQSQAAVTPPILNSRLDATATIYLVFDGATVADPAWAGGQTIVAAPSNLSASDMTNVFTRVKEDYWPFKINVTTDPARYNAAPVGKRMRCIVTSTDTAGPGAGGIAYVGSFAQAGSNFTDDIPCWDFNPEPVSIADAASHELGHTFGLIHDGRELPNGSGGTTHEEYYGGHGSGATSWGPIMGAPYSETVTQWSKGEYQYANNQENDLGIIANATNGFGYVPDEVGTSPATAPAIGGDANGSVSQAGVIAVAGDTDYYAITTTGGNVTLAAAGAPDPDLDIALTLLDHTGATVASANPSNSLAASLSATLTRGTYYVAVTDSGTGDVLTTGYSTYGSIGAYTLSGTVPGLGVVFYPNLAFTPPTGATDNLVIANQPGSHTDAPIFYATVPLYLDFAVANNGEASATTAFSTSVYVDDVLVGTAPATVPLAVGGTSPANDFSLGLLSAGTHTIRLQADGGNTLAESNETDNAYSRTITVTVPGPPSLTDASTATGRVGTPFSYQITASNVPTSYTATGLPAGLSLNAATGVVSGTPLATGTSAVALTATNSLGTGTGTLTLTINPALPVITSATAAAGEVAQPFSYQLTAANAPTSFGAAGLPAGLTLDTATGTISGSPTAAGTYSVTLTASNVSGSGTATLTLGILAARPVITIATSAAGRVNVPFTFQIVASSSPTSYGATGLPAGLTLNPVSGLISGAPTVTGTFAVTVSATNATRTVSSPLTLTITASPTVVAWGASAQTGVPADLDNDTVGLAAGATHSLALRQDGTVEAWGANDLGQLNVPAGLGSVVSLAAGAAHSLALRSDGIVFAWGANYAGQTTVPTGLTGVVAISAGSAHSLAHRADGTVVAWGDNSAGQSTVPTSLADVVAVAAGFSHSVALRADGTVVVWGSNAAGQLNLPAGLTGVRQVAAAADLTLLLRTDGSVLSYGDNGAAQSAQPAGLVDIVSIAASGQHALAVHANGLVTAWGSNASGESTVPGALTNVALVAAGGAHSVALLRPGLPPYAVAALPVNGAELVGGSAFFFADAVGTGALAYQWVANGVDLPGETLPFLILDNLQPSQAGVYTFRVTNATGSTVSAPAHLTLTEPLPTITLAPSIPQVPFGAQPFGAFTITRTGDVSQQINVNYAIKGSAANGTDYLFLKGVRKLKAGKASAPIKVFPLLNPPASTKKTVVLLLLPGDGYIVGTAGKVKVKIVGTE